MLKTSGVILRLLRSDCHFNAPSSYLHNTFCLKNQNLENHRHEKRSRPASSQHTARQLHEVGGDNFILEEGKALLEFTPIDSVVSLTGSNPMYAPAMEHLRNYGTFVFIDVQNEDIVQRLEKMKVSRIVGQEAGVHMRDILQYRQQFYEAGYDIRVICEQFESQDDIAKKIVKALEASKADTYISTRNEKLDNHTNQFITFNDVVLKGLAPDGGLFVPDRTVPELSLKQWNRLIGLTFQDKAVRILEQWILDFRSVSQQDLKEYIKKAYSSFNCLKVAPVVHLQGKQYIQELFHGPTASFKDLALQLMPQLFQHAVYSCSASKSTSARFLILVATSGDTGGAVLDGFRKLKDVTNIDVMVLYPQQGISSIQQQQMTSMQGDNLHVVGVDSDFDFCQSTIKSIFNNDSFREELNEKHNCQISAANSINWGRLLPQVVYHAVGYLDMVEQGIISLGDRVDVCIPTGNFGNILAAFYAKEMGIPFNRLICASNANNILTEFFQTGRYDLSQRTLLQTTSPAIDILKSSNLERFLYHLSGGDSGFVKSCYDNLAESGSFEVPSELKSKIDELIVADSCTEEECHKAIKETWEQTGYMLDPHTAVAKVVADRHSSNLPMIISSTAHFAKFADSVLDALNIERDNLSPKQWYTKLRALNTRPVMHRDLESQIELESTHNTILQPNINEIMKEIRKFISK
ncbi:unnamed protein product [Owenia fusiformis]|uniref:Threonine synthase n=1 Tax=Owenia fusiformis TaxID=6347 RepID=A0A8S4NRN5_OWEFU|nr:unnamed protein product [Owenia fusiformis]